MISFLDTDSIHWRFKLVFLFTCNWIVCKWCAFFKISIYFHNFFSVAYIWQFQKYSKIELISLCVCFCKSLFFQFTQSSNKYCPVRTWYYRYHSITIFLTLIYIYLWCVLIILAILVSTLKVSRIDVIETSFTLSQWQMLLYWKGPMDEFCPFTFGSEQ